MRNGGFEIGTDLQEIKLFISSGRTLKNCEAHITTARHKPGQSLLCWGEGGRTKYHTALAALAHVCHIIN
jgi:hypothetical protein